MQRADDQSATDKPGVRLAGSQPFGSAKRKSGPKPAPPVSKQPGLEQTQHVLVGLRGQRQSSRGQLLPRLQVRTVVELAQILGKTTDIAQAVGNCGLESGVSESCLTGQLAGETLDSNWLAEPDMLHANGLHQVSAVTCSRETAEDGRTDHVPVGSRGVAQCDRLANSGSEERDFIARDGDDDWLVRADFRDGDVVAEKIHRMPA